MTSLKMKEITANIDDDAHSITEESALKNVAPDTNAEATAKSSDDTVRHMICFIRFALDTLHVSVVHV